MTLLAAVHLLSMPDVDPATGLHRYNYDTGKRSERRVLPGEVFEFTDDQAELQWLRDQEAVRDPTPAEVDAYNLASGVL